MMATETESGASLLQRRDYARAVPALKSEIEKYPSNPRIRLQYADALAGAGSVAEAVEQYEATARYYDDNGLTVQAIGVRKKAEKVQAQNAAAEPKDEAGRSEPLFKRKVPKSPLFEVLSEEEREALVREMEFEQHDEGGVIISEGEAGSSMYVITAGAVKVYTRSVEAGSGPVYLARLVEGDFFGEVSVLTGKPRTATITAAQPTELLRLDKEKLDNALSTYPGIRRVLDEFYRKRAKHTVEAMIETLKKKS